MLRDQRRQFRTRSHMPIVERPVRDTSQHLRQFTQIRRAVAAVVGEEDEVVHRHDDAPIGSWTDTYVLHLLDLGGNPSRQT
jgi:hypothetical protein